MQQVLDCGMAPRLFALAIAEKATGSGIARIQALLGSEADSLLGYMCKGIPKDTC
jgi:hypothetical protein